jgi:alkylation response protein AidB-like acyl-CoA dehydrogenase
MSSDGVISLEERLRELQERGELDLPLPARGETAVRHHGLLELGREDLSVARLAEAHIDAVAILAEAGRRADPEALYAVWASEAPNHASRLERSSRGSELNGSKPFCSGAGIVDRALVTVRVPEPRLLDVDLRANRNRLGIDGSGWIASEFAETCTATVEFIGTRIAEDAFVGGPGWYLERPGFWHGACGPAACWAGGALGLVDYALAQKQDDPHTQAHLGAMSAAAWALRGYLETAGDEIDRNPCDVDEARVRALTVRHLVEQACSDILRRFARAYGPRPLAFDCETSRRYHELELYIRQCHGERDLESLGRQLQAPRSAVL